MQKFWRQILLAVVGLTLILLSPPLLGHAQVITTVTGLDADSAIIKDASGQVYSHDAQLPEQNKYTVSYKWQIPNTAIIKSGDTMTVTVPANVHIPADASFPMKGTSGLLTIGTFFIAKGSHIGTVTLNSNLQYNTLNRNGYINLYVYGNLPTDSDEEAPGVTNPGSEEPNTEEPGTEEPNTEKPGTEEPNTEKPGTEEPNTEEPGTEEPNTEKPGTEEPSTEEPGTEEPNTEKPGTEEPNTEKPGTEEPGTGEPNTEEPGTEEPNTEEPGTEEPNTEEPGTEEPGTGEPNTEEPGTEEPNTEEPGTEEPGTGEPNTEEPGTGEPNTEEPGTEEPNTEKPGTEEPGTEKPGTEEPSTKEPGTKEPGTKEPETSVQNSKQPKPVKPKQSTLGAPLVLVKTPANQTKATKTNNDQALPQPTLTTANAGSNSRQLPQTGEQASKRGLIIGLLGLSLILLVGLFSFRRQKKN
ncbi:hypothetical protein C5Z26_04985 [Lactobacillus sp. CBA3606]|uniref:Ig-like domain-containing protein n=1 Tax=Lactobacillus sp. CBA3606 TaxID=2099789 RepID=UPI000CFDE86C|nr:Ig-like domain-containing protein [Lactobacillus sp. CBA3606]AVK63495.1 hypothetical protein C5Z26_04985 [Lactobacillus sp. CBA3606]